MLLRAWCPEVAGRAGGREDGGAPVVEARLLRGEVQGNRGTTGASAFRPLPRAGHDCSLRLWSLDNKTCVQEITAHRKKHEEAIHAVACHPSKALIASAGADALAKVFV